MRLAALPLICLTLLAGCGTADDSGRLTVVATTPVVADLARNVAGGDAEVVALIPPNADPHDYELRPEDAEALSRADLVLRSGGDLDEWLADAIQSAGAEAPVVNLMEAVAAVEDDPHWWHDPANAIAAVERIATEAEALSGAGGRFRTRAEAYRARLEAMDAAIGGCIETVAEERRKLVTTHDALGYYARRYRLEVLGTVIPSLSTQGQPSAGDVARLVRDVRRAGVRTIFPEASVPAKVEQAIAREAGVEVGPELQADTLSEGLTYLDAMAANTRAIVGGLGGRCDL